MVLTLRLGGFYHPKKKMAILALYNINRLVFYNGSGKCLLPGTYGVLLQNRHFASYRVKVGGDNAIKLSL
jgi:hypothetical protein